MTAEDTVPRADAAGATDATGMTGTDVPAALAPVARFLERRAREEAGRIRADAEAAARGRLADARREAAAILAQATSAGAAEAAGLAASDAAQARRRARRVVLAARRDAYEELRRRSRAAASALRTDPALMARLRALAGDLAGPEAVVTEHPEGGYVAVAPGRRVDCSLPALADLALAALAARPAEPPGGAEDDRVSMSAVEWLWAC